MKISRLVVWLIAILLAPASYVWCAQHVVIIVIDGVRYTESLGAKEKYMARLWNDLRPRGTIYTNFRNDGLTLTCPGHASILTGNWQKIANDGSEQFSNPTLFELFRKQTGLPEQSCCVISGKSKLHVLTHSADTMLGMKYKANFVVNASGKNIDTYNALISEMKKSHPRAVIVNFAETDKFGHDNKWDEYLRAIKEVDSLVWLLWQHIQSDSVYKDSTTLLVTNDHGRHDEQHGGFKSHGDACESCRHIMLAAVGPEFKPGTVVSETASQVDIAPTAAQILNITFPIVQGRSLLHRTTNATEAR